MIFKAIKAPTWFLSTGAAGEKSEITDSPPFSKMNTTAFVRAAHLQGYDFQVSILNPDIVLGSIMVGPYTPLHVDIEYERDNGTVLLWCEIANDVDFAWPKCFQKIGLQWDPYSGTEYSTELFFARGSCNDMLKAFDLLLRC